MLECLEIMLLTDRRTTQYIYKSLYTVISFTTSHDIYNISCMELIVVSIDRWRTIRNSFFEVYAAWKSVYPMINYKASRLKVLSLIYKRRRIDSLKRRKMTAIVQTKSYISCFEWGLWYTGSNLTEVSFHPFPEIQNNTYTPVFNKTNHSYKIQHVTLTFDPWSVES